jgi:GcrA cell cycle regulator
MQSGDWTPEHSQALREYVTRGISFARAAAEINARFGPLTPAVPPSVAASEWGSSFRRGVRIGRCPRRRRGRRRHRGKGRRANTRPANRPRPEPQPEAIPAVAPAPVQLRCVGMAPRLISLVELEPCDCRCPYGGQGQRADRLLRAPPPRGLHAAFPSDPRGRHRGRARRRSGDAAAG